MTKLPVEVGDVPVDVTRTGRERVLVLAAVEDGDLVAGGEQIAHDVRADELRPAEDEDVHAVSRVRPKASRAPRGARRRRAFRAGSSRASAPYARR